MFLKSVVFMAACLGVAATAAAQTAAPAQAPAASAATSSDQIDGRIDMGLFRAAGSSGFVVGGGAAMRPFSVSNLEVAADADLTRQGGVNGLYVSGNLVYRITPPQSKATPFVGAGLGILHGAGNTQGRLQILGGVEVPVQGRMTVRGDVRFLFTSGHLTTLILGGIGF